MNSENIRSRISDIAERTESLIDSMSDEVGFAGDYKRRMNDEVHSLLKAEKPKVLVCGIYSAGKSTIVNVLLGEELAEVGAQPKTDAITPYEPKGKNYTLIDSPGVDAPISHEKITDEYVSKCHALLFVVSTKMLESKENYKKLIAWMKYDKPLIIVLNDKTGEDNLEKSEEIKRLREKIVSNLKEAGYDVNAKYDIAAVNAKRAADSLFGGKNPKMYNLSNMKELEKTIENAVAAEGGYQLLKAPLGQMRDILNAVEHDISMAASGNENNEALSKKLERLTREKSEIIESSKIKVRATLEDRKAILMNLALNSDNADELQTRAKEIFDDAYSDIGGFVKGKVQELAHRISFDFGDDYGIKADQNGNLTINVGGNDISALDYMKNVGGLAADDSEFGNIMRNGVVGAMGGAAIGSAIAASLPAVIPTVATTVATFVGGTVAGGAAAGAGLGAVLGPIGAVVGALGGLIFGGMSIKKRRAEEERRMQEAIDEQNRRMLEEQEAAYKKVQLSVNNSVEDAVRELTGDIMSSMEAYISDVTNVINTKVSEGRKKSEKFKRALSEIKELKQELVGIGSIIAE